MFEQIYNDIKKYNTIVIERHNRPDLDALGSQLGLKKAILDTFPEKTVYAVGDKSVKYAFIGDMDSITEEDLPKEYLCIVCDVAVDAMISGNFHHTATKTYVLDHHENPCDFEATAIIDHSRIAAAEIVATFLFEYNFVIKPESATCLIGGVISDSGRFQYPDTNENTFLTAAKLVSAGADMQFIYLNIYTETLESKKMKSYFTEVFRTTKNNVAYLKNDKDTFDRFPVTFSTISRGMVGVMAGIEGINIWCNFTKDIEHDSIVGEFRSRGLSIVDIAKKYGGGGHAQACGATLQTWDEVDRILQDFDKRMEEFKNGTNPKEN